MSDKENAEERSVEDGQAQAKPLFSRIDAARIKEEAARLDRSLSWSCSGAWKLARVEIKKLPSVNDINEDEDEARSSSTGMTARGHGHASRIQRESALQSRCGSPLRGFRSASRESKVRTSPRPRLSWRSLRDLPSSSRNL